MEREKYTQRCECDNCHHAGLKEFIKGQSSDGYFICPKCGCRDFHKIGWKTERGKIIL